MAGGDALQFDAGAAVLGVQLRQKRRGQRVGLIVDRQQQTRALGELMAAALHESRRLFVGRQDTLGIGLGDMRADRGEVGMTSCEHQDRDEQRLERQNDKHGHYGRRPESA